MAREKVTVEVQLPVVVRDAVVAVAAERGCTPNKVVLDALRSYFGALAQMPHEADEDAASAAR